MSSYPPIFESVWLCAADGAAFECRVLGQRGGNLQLLPPDEPGLVDGGSYELVWQTTDDLYRQSVRVELSQDPKASLVLLSKSAVLRADRRENVRVPIDTTVIVSLAGRTLPLVAHSVDLSEGGIRVSVSAEQQTIFAVGKSVRIGFTLRSAEYSIDGRVLRLDAPWTGDEADVVIGFDASPQITGRLRRAILVETVFA